MRRAGPTSRGTRLFGACAGALALLCGARSQAAEQAQAPAVEQMPVIVTYELQRQSTADRTRVRDPKAFWISQIMARVEDKRADMHMQLPEQKTVRLLFTVTRDGRLASSAVASSSGVPALDQIALGMVQQAQPFPPMPTTLAEAELTFALPIRFR